MKSVISEDMFEKEYGQNIYDVNPYWNKLESPEGMMYKWDSRSTYIHKPPFFDTMQAQGSKEIRQIKNARVLAAFGDSISTDHISPAGAIGVDSPAGKYLMENGVRPVDFNTYGARRGNHEVMMRGTFANNRIKNLMLPGSEGGFTVHYPGNEKMSIYDAAMVYRNDGVPLVVIAGAEYGSGSSRDWAAKGPMLLGVRAVLAKSFERIHRSNLIGMGIIPLQFENGQDAVSLGIDYEKEITIGLSDTMKPRERIKIVFTRKGDGKLEEAMLVSRIDTPIEMEYYRADGILNFVTRKILSG